MQWHTGASPGWWRGGGFSHLGETQKSHTECYRIRCHEPTVSRTRETLISNWGRQGSLSLFRQVCLEEGNLWLQIQPVQVCWPWKVSRLGWNCWYLFLAGLQVITWHLHGLDRVDWSYKPLHPRLTCDRNNTASQTDLYVFWPRLMKPNKWKWSCILDNS